MQRHEEKDSSLTHPLADNTASRLAEKHFGPLTPAVAFAVDRAYQQAMRQARVKFLRPLGAVDPATPNVHFYWQFMRDDNFIPADASRRHRREATRLRIYFISEDQEPYYIEVRLANYVKMPEDMKTWLADREGPSAIDVLVRDRIIRPNLDAHARAMLIQHRKRSLSTNHRNSKKFASTLYGGFPEEHYGCKLADEDRNEGRKARDLQLAAFADSRAQLFRKLKPLLSQGGGKDAAFESFKQECGEAMRAQLIAEETANIDDYAARLDRRAVEILRGTQAFSYRAYRWLRYGTSQMTDTRGQSLNEDHYRYRRQFLAAAPLFAHLALRWSLRDDGYRSREEIERLNHFIHRGKELFAIETGEDGKPKAGEGLRLFAEYLALYHGQANQGYRASSTSAELLQKKLIEWPKGLRQLAKMKPSDIGDLRTFLLVLPKLIGCDLAHFPRTPEAWKMASFLTDERLRLPQDMVWRDAGRNWEAALCGLNARLAAAKRDGIAHGQTLETALGNCHDYADQIFHTLIWPAAVAAIAEKGGRYGAWPGYGEQERYLKKRFMEQFTLNTLLDGSLQYHKPHILQAYNGAIFDAKHMAEKKEGPENRWLAPTVDFTIPEGTRHNGVDIGGTKITWLCSTGELGLEAQENKNCVSGYTEQCINHGHHILRMLAPNETAGGPPVRTTAELIENKHLGEPADPKKLRQVRPNQNMMSGNVAVAENSPSRKAQEWLAEQINAGQLKRAAMPNPRSATPAPINPQTGLPDFTQIDFVEMDKVRQAFVIETPNFMAYDPRVPGAFATALNAARQHKLLPGRLRGAQTPEALLAALGVSATQNELVFSRAPLKPAATAPGAAAAPPAPGL